MKFQPEGLQLYWKEQTTQIYSCKTWEIFKNTFFTEHLRWLLLALATEAVTSRCPIKKVIWKILQNSQELL